MSKSKSLELSYVPENEIGHYYDLDVTQIGFYNKELKLLIFDLLSLLVLGGPPLSTFP